MFCTFLCVLGLIGLIKPLLNIVYAIYMHLRDLLIGPIYGPGWAIVTGATDGIGFGFCQELAKQGFNICMISRNQHKLNTKLNELKSQFGDKVQYKTIQADFKHSHNDNFFPNIYEQLQQIEPAILVNNVGIAQLTYLKDQSLSSMKDIISVNCLPMAALSSYFIKRISNRTHKSAIVNISSYSWVNPMPYMSVYAATKGFNDVLSVSCARENPDIHVLSVRAMLVSSGSVKKGKSLLVPTSRECARGSLKYLGYRETTAGHLKHEIMSHITDAIPQFLFKIISSIEAKKAYQQFRHKQ